jgi:glyoxylase-like metal-dependent hydrolase (beta-lactamase superfamily II)
MKIDTFILGAYETNCYILRESETAKDCLIVDAGLEPGELIDFFRQNKLNPVAIVLTHGHIDHIAGVAAFRAEFPTIKVYIHKLDADMLTKANSNLSAMMGEAFSTEPADMFIEDKSIVEEAGIKLEALHTPGHTPGGICLYSKNDGIVFTDDALFADSVGRTDFPGGSMTQLINGIRKKLLTLPDDTIVYPGHGPATTIAWEKAHNQFLQ